MTIKLTREEAQQVLDALLLHAAMDELEEEAIELLRARLAQPEPSVEPVAWRIRSIDPMRDWTLMYRCPTPETKFSNIEVQPLYTTPPQREWAKQIKGVRVDGCNVVVFAGNNDAARDLCGALLEEKNHG